MEEGTSDLDGVSSLPRGTSLLTYGNSWEGEDGGCTYYGDPECPSLHAWFFQFIVYCCRVAVALLYRLFSPVAQAAAPRFSGLPEQLLRIGLSVGGVSLLVLLASLVIWQRRLRRYNCGDGSAFGLLGPSPLRFPLHAWKAFASASSPKYCCICRELISGFLIYRNKGWECSICRRACHNTCLAHCDFLPCKMPSAPGADRPFFQRRSRRQRNGVEGEAYIFKAQAASAAQKHQLVEGVVASDAVCCCCGLACGSTFGLEGLRCLWCCRTLHAECLPQLSRRCDRGELRHLVLEPASVRPLLSAAANPQVLIRLAAALRPEGVGVTGAMRGLRTLATILQQSVSSQVKRLNASLLESIRHARKGSGPQPADKAEGAGAKETSQDKKMEGQTKEAAIEEMKGKIPENSVEGASPLDDGGVEVEGRSSVEKGSAGTLPPLDMSALRRRAEKKKASSDGGAAKGEGSVDSSSSKSESDEGGGGSCNSDSSRSSSPSQASVVEEFEKVEDAELLLAKKVAGPSVALASTSSKAGDEQRRRLEETLAQVLSPKSTSCWRLRHAVLKWLPPDATPVVAVVNGMSGGQAGRAVYRELLFRLNPLQVVDIHGEGGLEKALTFFKPLALTGRLRVLVCGGDGTVGWVLDAIQRTCVVQPPQPREAKMRGPQDSSTEASSLSRPTGQAGSQLSLEGNSNSAKTSLQKPAKGAPSPSENRVVAKVPVAICPLGTGNDLSNVLGWGMSFDGDVVQLANKFLYGEVGFRDFLGSRPSDLGAFRLYADDVEVTLPTQLAGICIVNIPSFAGGVKLWGDSETRVESSHHSWRRAGGHDACSSSRVFKTTPRLHFKTSPRVRRSSLGKPFSDEFSPLCETVEGGEEEVSDDNESSVAFSSKCASRLSHESLVADEFGEGLARRGSEKSRPVVAASGRTAERRGVSAHSSLKNSLWQPQKIDDGLIEVVAFKSLIHLGQVQVGLAKALRLCQARRLRLYTRTPTPLQIDGEPSMLDSACEIVIFRRGQASVLRALECSPRTQTLARIQQVLQQALDRQVITEAQSLILLNEFQRSLP